MTKLRKKIVKMILLLYINNQLCLKMKMMGSNNTLVTEVVTLREEKSALEVKVQVLEDEVINNT